MSNPRNNIPYNQANETTWLDWSRHSEHADVFRFFKMMIAFCKIYSSISRSRFWRDDIHWYGAYRDAEMLDSSKAVAWFFRGE